MDHFYDGQIRRYLTQFMRVLSNFSYKDAKGQLLRVPVRYGDMNRQVSQILKKNTENTIPSAPFIACYIKDIQFDRPRVQDPSFVSTVQVRERAYDQDGQEYLNIQGANYTVERIMPSPYMLNLTADIWTTNTEMKLQLWEQIAVLFNPSLELQTTDNFLDWTSLTTLTLSQMVWSSRTVPAGLEENIDVLTMNFETPIWITPPAKVKQLGIITKIITSAFTANVSHLSSDYVDLNELIDQISADREKVIVTPGNFDLLVLDNVAQLLTNQTTDNTIDPSSPRERTSWLRLLDLYPGQFRAGLSQIRLTKSDGTEIISYISLDPTDETRMIMNIDSDTIPTNTLISGRGSVDAIVNPETFTPNSPASGTRYLILEDVNVNGNYGTPGYDGPDSWKNLDNSDPVLYANDIIEWNGSAWETIFDSSETTDIVHITNSYTGVQYKWSNGSWSKSFEGIYSREIWRLIL